MRPLVLCVPVPAAVTDLTVTGAGLTWTLQESRPVGDGRATVYVYTAMTETVMPSFPVQIDYRLGGENYCVERYAQEVETPLDEQAFIIIETLPG